ncbi:MAG TPA: DUF4062 domain-containing protein, partial [Phycisphaerae bacterium]|nr:DUF4062 domain-containing protein [Phycisphaerae bacterium]
MREFIAGLGFEPMLSEFDSFPVDPSTGVIENCRKVIDERADIFVLIVGKRHGSVVDTGKSVTNLEYLAARGKEIPVYAFVTRSVLDVLPVWKENPEATFPGVDSPSLFEFVDSIRSCGEVWVYPFDTAQDIMAALRTQWAYLFYESLQLWTKFRGAGLEELPPDVSGAALQLIIERPFAWEYRLFDRVLRDELKKAESARRDLDIGLCLGAHEYFEPVQLTGWIGAQFSGLSGLIGGLAHLLNTTYREATGPVGESGDPAKIVYVAQRVGQVYSATIEWSRRFRRVHAGEEFRRLLDLCAAFSSDCLRKIETLSNDTSRALDPKQASFESLLAAFGRSARGRSDARPTGAGSSSVSPVVVRSSAILTFS